MQAQVKQAVAKIIKATDQGAGCVARYEHGVLLPLEADNPSPEEDAVEEAGEPEIDPATVLAEARVEAERMAREAYAEGFRRGTQAGKEEFTKSVGNAADLLVNAAQAIVQAREAFLDSLEPQVMALVRAISARVLRREASVGPDILATTVRSSLGNLIDRERVTLRVNSRDLEVLRAQRADLLEEFPSVMQLSITADDSILPGGCIADAESVQVDARLDAQLERILDALTG